MRLLVVEDEAMVARRLLRLLGEILDGERHEIHHEASLEEARRHLRAGRALDALFLDLNLRGQDGFDLLAEASAGPFYTVIVSAHHDRALEAFEYGVVDFVPKPFGIERLRKAVERLRRLLEGASRTGAEDDNRLRHLAVRKARRVELLPVDQVVTIHGAGDYSELRCADGSRHLHAKTLDRLENLLPSRFVRVHRSAIVDLERAEALECEPGSRYHLRLQGGERVRVGRTRVADLRARWP